MEAGPSLITSECCYKMYRLEAIASVETPIHQSCGQYVHTMQHKANKQKQVSRIQINKDEKQVELCYLVKVLALI